MPVCVIVPPGYLAISGDILVVRAGEGVGYWHLVDGGHGCYSESFILQRTG